MTTQTNPEIGRSIDVAGIETNYHDMGNGSPLVMIHGSGPGVTGWANWRLVMPDLAQHHRVLVPDILGFGYTERPTGIDYGLQTWVEHAVGFLDALELDKIDLVGNSFGGALSLAIAIRYPSRVRRLVLMGAAGVPFELTPALDAVWGYTPSVENMRKLMDTFAFNKDLVNDDLARMRYEASIRPGIQEAYSAMFPAPRQRAIEALASKLDDIAALPHETLIIHGRDDVVVPLGNSLQFLELIPRSQLHVFGQCGHWTQIEHASRFSRLLLDFLGELDG